MRWAKEKASLVFALVRTLVLALVIALGLSPGTSLGAAACGDGHAAVLGHGAGATAPHAGHGTHDRAASDGQTGHLAIRDGGPAPADGIVCCTCCIPAAFFPTPAVGNGRSVLAPPLSETPDVLAGIAPEPVPPPPKRQV